MPGDDSNHFSGDPLAGSSTRARFYAQITGPRVTAGLGDAVQVARPDGTYAGIIIALWQEGSKKKPKNFVEVLWFDTLRDQEKRPVGLPGATNHKDILTIQARATYHSRIVCRGHRSDTSSGECQVFVRMGRRGTPFPAAIEESQGI